MFSVHAHCVVRLSEFSALDHNRNDMAMRRSKSAEFQYTTVKLHVAVKLVKFARSRSLVVCQPRRVACGSCRQRSSRASWTKRLCVHLFVLRHLPEKK